MAISKSLMACLLATPLALLAQNPSGAAPGASTTTEGPAWEPTWKMPTVYAEAGGFYHSLTNNYGSWRGLDTKIGYTANKRVAPFFTFSRQTRRNGSQVNYGAYSYLTINKRLWSIVGISGAPEGRAILYPKTRVDGSLFIGVPSVPGMFISTGYTNFFMHQGGGQIFSVGSLYYHRKLILSGSVNYNRSRPGSVNSASGQGGFQYGSQGKYWFGAGLVGGKVAYQVINVTPFDVRFNTAGVNVFYQRWIARRFGLIWRYDYQNQFTAFQRNGVTMSGFFEF